MRLSAVSEYEFEQLQIEKRDAGFGLEQSTNVMVPNGNTYRYYHNHYYYRHRRRGYYRYTVAKVSGLYILSVNRRLARTITRQHER